MEQYRRIRAVIDLDAIRYNMESMKSILKPGTGIIAVVKSDGYGHGAVPIAQDLDELDALTGFAVATFEEAMILRECGIRKPVIILGYTFPECYERMGKEEIQPAVFREDMLFNLQKAAEKCGKKIKIHIKVDTGMSRIGIQPDDAGLEFVRKCMNTEGIEIEGIFTHFARADEADLSYAVAQLNQFEDFLTRIKEELGLHIPLCHCSNSAGIIELPEANMDAVRAGISMYGLWPSDEVHHNRISFRPALSLTSHIILIKELGPGKQISYGGTFETKDVTRVATIPVGYGDGYPRSLSGKGYVLIHGKKAPILGRVCMDQMMVDVTAVPEAREDDKVVLIGKDGDEEITMEYMGELSGRFNYELACCLNRRVPRVYVKEGKVVAVKDNLQEYL